MPGELTALAHADSLSQETIPTIVVASNCDRPPKAWQAEYAKVEKLCTSFENIDCYQTSLNAPETHKRCVSVILRNVILDRRRRQHTHSSTAQSDVNGIRVLFPSFLCVC